MKKTVRSKAKTAQIIQLPHHDFSFKACNLKGKSLLEKYDANRVYVDIVDGVIKTEAPVLKRKVGAMKPLYGIEVGDMISDLKSVAGDFEALASIFEMAAARLTVVKVKLV
jgi:hypothetical protein